VLEAVLFDWGNTLVHFEWDETLLAAGHRAGLAALGREGEAEAFTTRLRTEVLPRLEPGDDYESALRDLLGVDADIDAFLDAEHAAWQPARSLVGSAHALLESLRSRGLKLAVVANAWPEPARLVRREIEQLGVAERVDAIVLSGDVGVRKPAPEIFERALDELAVAAERALYVGDRLVADVQGAADVGMTTAQALWFRADEDTSGIEPDFQAFTPMDVLNVVRRLEPAPD
jgi:HAD superfamily hydrolase (TIGR01662 family)